MAKLFSTHQLSGVLSLLQLFLKIVRAQVSEIRMQSIGIVKHGNILQYVLLSFRPGLIVSPLHAFLFQTSKEAFNHLQCSDSDKIGNNHEYGRNCDKKADAGDEIREDHEAQPANQWDDCFLFLAIQEEAEPD